LVSTKKFLCNEKGPDQPWFDGRAKNEWLPANYEAVINHVEEDFYLSPSSSSATYSYNNTIRFEIDKRIDMLGKIEFQLTRAAVTGVTNPAFADFEAFRSIDNVKFKFANKVFWTVYGSDLFKKQHQRKNAAKRDSAAILSLGNLSLTQRRTNAAAITTWVADLEVPWDKIKKNIPLHTLGDKILVEVTLRSLTNCTEFTAGTVPVCAVSSPYLIIHGVHLPQKQKDIIDMMTKGAGYGVKIASYEYVFKEAFAAVSGGALRRDRIRLRNFKTTSVKFDLDIILQTDEDAVDGTVNPYNFVQCSRFWLEDSGAQVTPKIPMADTYSSGTAPLGYGYHSSGIRVHPDGDNGLYIGVLPLCHNEFVEQADDHAVGGRSIFQYNNPELVVEWDGGHNAAYYNNVRSKCHNMLIYQGGEVRVLTS
jgi:hypothetical protein